MSERKKRVELLVEEMAVKKEGEEFKLTLEEGSEIFKKLALHGFAQKLGDAVASMTEVKGFSQEERVEKMREMEGMLNSGTWSKKRESGIVRIPRNKIEALSAEDKELLKKMGLV